LYNQLIGVWGGDSVVLGCKSIHWSCFRAAA